LQRRLATTMVYVTHDQVEAMTMGDRVAVLREGVLQQCAPPRELYNRPVNEFVAGFIGSPSMNLLRLPVDDGAVRLGGAAVPLGREAARAADVVLGVRPEQWATITEGDEVGGQRVAIEMDIDVVEELGADAYIYGRAYSGEQHHDLVARADWRAPPRRGDRVT